MSSIRFAVTILLTALSLSGCGTYVPDIKEVWDKDIPEDPVTHRFAVPGAAQIEYEIKKRVYCDIKEAVQFINNHPAKSGKPIRPYLIPATWIAKIQLSLQVDESSNTSPGVVFTQPMASSTSFNFGLGGTFSSVATRVDKFNPTYSVAYMMQPYTDESVCLHPEQDPFVSAHLEPAVSSPLILSDLGIHDWLVGSEVVSRLIQSETRTKGRMQPDDTLATDPNDVISLETKFIVTTSGSVSPSWKLVKVSVNGSNPLFTAGRVRTHDLIVTIGPNDKNTENAHLASQIGQAVSAGNRSFSISP